MWRCRRYLIVSEAEILYAKGAQKQSNEYRTKQMKVRMGLISGQGIHRYNDDRENLAAGTVNRKGNLSVSDSDVGPSDPSP